MNVVTLVVAIVVIGAFAQYAGASCLGYLAEKFYAWQDERKLRPRDPFPRWVQIMARIGRGFGYCHPYQTSAPQPVIHEDHGMTDAQVVVDSIKRTQLIDELNAGLYADYYEDILEAERGNTAMANWIKDNESYYARYLDPDLVAHIIDNYAR